MPLSVAQKLIKAHLVRGSLAAGEPIALRIDQTLTQDATGTLAMLSLEAMGIDRVKTEVSVQYICRPQSAAGRQSQCRGSSLS